jgi:hypothetical protein
VPQVIRHHRTSGGVWFIPPRTSSPFRGSVARLVGIQAEVGFVLLLNYPLSGYSRSTHALRLVFKSEMKRLASFI